MGIDDKIETRVGYCAIAILQEQTKREIEQKYENKEYEALVDLIKIYRQYEAYLCDEAEEIWE